MKSVQVSVDQDTPMQCNQMRFIFQYSPPSGSQTSFIGFEYLDPISKKINQQQIRRHYKNFLRLL